jgi:protoporphyrinogen/coproporphyrinogen III oxidase
MIIVIGGGPAGLAAAVRLREAGHRVRLLEASDRVGGKLASVERDGYLIDRGAFFLPTTHRRMLAVADQLGISERLAPGGFVLAVARDGKVHHVRGAHLIRDALSTRLISSRAKLGLARVAPEVWRARRATPEQITGTAASDTESVAQWSRRLHPEVARFVTDPTMRAVFAISPEAVSKVDFLAVVALFGGARLLAFDRGMAVYARAAAEGLDVALGARAVAVEEIEGSVAVTWTGPEGEQVEHAEGCVIATPAVTAVALWPGLDEERREYLSRVRDGKLLILNVALARAPAGVDATYLEIPDTVHPFLGGIAFDHHKARGRVPDGHGLLTLAPLNDWCEAHWDDDEQQITAALVDALDRILPGTAADVEFTVLNRWNQQYNPVGHYRGLGAFRAACETRDHRVQLAGEYHSSPNLNAATASGEWAARRLLASLRGSG